MLHYTRLLSDIVADLAARLPALSHVDPSRILVFGRAGRTGTRGPVASCHCLELPETEPGYYYWRDVESGRLTRRTPWFNFHSPEVLFGGRRMSHMISVALPRFCDQDLRRLPKRRYYPDRAPWIAKLDTLVHELYHIDPHGPGFRPAARGEVRVPGLHGPDFYRDVAALVESYLEAGPASDALEVLELDAAALEARYGGILATTFRGFPSFPQRYELASGDQPLEPRLPIANLRPPSQVRFSDGDLVDRLFARDGRSRVWTPPAAEVAAGALRVAPLADGLAA